jgi:hypothetical protein
MMSIARPLVLANSPVLGSPQTVAMAQTSNPAQRANQQARLILQNPRALEEAQMPALRLSQEMNVTNEPQLSSAEARQVWESLQLKPGEVIAQSAQLREAKAKTEAATKAVQALQSEVMQLKTQLQEQQATAWQQPAVYAAGAAVLGLGFLWLLERKKKLAAQEHLLAMTDELRSGLDMSLGPSINFAESLLPAQVFSAPPQKQSKQANIAARVPLGHDLPVDSSLRQDAEMQAIAPSASWWKRLKRQSDADAMVSAGGYESSAAYPSTQAMVQSTEIDAYEDSTELEDMQAPVQAYYDPTQANVELLSQTRIKPASGDDAMGHLLEIRMAVQALCVLGQPLAAQTLLYQHIEAVPNTCAWAYMEYLDLCAQLSQRDEFEAMRKRYRVQFNRLAPYWMEPNASIQALDTYERPMLELSIAWSNKEEARTLIATWLLGTLHARRLFQLPAYHDLLDLYEMLEFYEAEPPPADWVPTVSLLDLDYEFAIDVKIEAQPEQEALRSIPAVKTGNFAVDFNVAAGVSQPAALNPLPEIPNVANKPGVR